MGESYFALMIDVSLLGGKFFLVSASNPLTAAFNRVNKEKFASKLCSAASIIQGKVLIMVSKAMALDEKSPFFHRVNVLAGKSNTRSNIAIEILSWLKAVIIFLTNMD